MLSPSPARKPARALLALTLTALALAAAACGGSSSNTTSTNAATTSSAASTPTGAATSTGTANDVQSAFDAALRKNLIESQHLKPETADCVIAKLHATLSEQELEQIASGDVPQSLTKKAFEAGFECASAGG